LADDDLSVLPDLLQGYLDRASETAALPGELGPPNTSETMHDLHNRLLLTRSAMTSLSSLIGELTLFQGRVEATLIERKGALEDAEAEAVSTRKKSPLEDYSSAREKNALLGAATLTQTRSVRRVGKLLAQVRAAAIYCRGRHQELDRAVRDVDVRVRIVGYEDTRL
jgi:hypothetical protein